MPTIKQNTTNEFFLLHKKSSEKYKAGYLQRLNGSNVTLGRSSSCTVSFGETYSTVSREHASISKQGESWVIKHISQTNPTYVNGKIVKDQFFLFDGDIIRLSDQGAEMVFKLNETMDNNIERETRRKSMVSEPNIPKEKINSGKNCQFCNETIQTNAMVCKHCQREQLTPKQIEDKAQIIAGRYWWIALIVSVFLASILPWLFIVGIVASAIALHFYSTYIKQNWSILQIHNQAGEIKERSRRRVRNFFIFIGVSLLVLIITNPDETKMKSYIKAVDNINAVDVVDSESYLVFSAYKVRIIDFNGQREEIYIGVLGRFYKADN
ncbi:MAG: FHA domain-containing protein [Bacteroidales bacterium]